MAQQENGYTVLNQFPREQFNVLIPVQSLQAISAMQKIVINRVELDTRLGQKTTRDRKTGEELTKTQPIGNDIYQERNGEYAITKVGGMKLAAAANISIVRTDKNTPEACQRCFELAAATRNVPSCGSCESRFNASYTVSIRVPELSGGFRILSGTKEVDVQLDKSRMTEKQFREYLPNVAAQAESKAFMRALRMALGLQGTYPYAEIKKPFIVAHVVPDLDNPTIQQLAAQNMLQSMGLLYENTDSGQRTALPSGAPVVTPEPATTPSQAQLPAAREQAAPPPHPAYSAAHESEEPLPEYLQGPPMEDDDPGLIICEGCSSPLVQTGSWSPEAMQAYSMRVYKCTLCASCQREARKAGEVH